jgi:endonuclease/exonuclease/phosphatase family metal-dependent hydrolase
MSRRQFLGELALPALTVAFGLQAIRVFVPGLTWILGDRFGQGAFVLGGAALLIFSAAFAAGWIRRLLGPDRAVIVTAGGLGVLRLLMQVWWGEPVINLVLATIGTALFVLFLPVFLAESRGGSAQTLGRFALGLLGGILLDTAWHAATLTYDAAWQQTWQMVLPTVALVIVQWLVLRGRWRGASADPSRISIPLRGVLAWACIGPLLFLQLVVLQNVARLAALTGWRLPLVSIWILLGDLLALAAAAWALRQERGRAWVLGLASGAILVAASVVWNTDTAWGAAVGVLAGHLSAAVLMVVVVRALVGEGRSGSASITAAGGVGMVLLVALILAYYVVYQISLPYANTTLEVVAAALVAVCGLLATTRARGVALAPRRTWLVVGMAAVLLVPALVRAAAWQEPQAEPGEGYPVRVMTFNLHNGLNPYGHLDIEALAKVIEEDKADVVVLQEVSRGWLISGRLDMLTWLSQRLGLPYVSGPTADPFWGNAVLSRYPVIEYENHDLPPRDLFLLRGFTSVTLDIGGGDTLRVIATHFHHVEGDSDIRQPQARAVAEFWDGSDNTVLLGDLNARPDAPEIAILREAGLIDAGAEADEFTFHSTDPYERIDYIWVSPDLTATEVVTRRTTASDHLPVSATVTRR